MPSSRAVPSRPPSTVPQPKPARRALTPQSVPYALVESPEGLDPFVGFLFSLVDGKSNLAEIIEASGMPQDDVVKIVLDLVGKGVVGVR